jgi:hypothetical protein
LVKFKEVDFIGEDEEDNEEMKTAEIIAEPAIERRQVPPGARVKEKIAKSTRCSVCGSKTDEMCFFCEWAVCDEHYIRMQIVTDTGNFGNVIQSCPDCADRRNGREPTQEEAADVGFFFKIKPYHEWKILL